MEAETELLHRRQKASESLLRRWQGRNKETAVRFTAYCTSKGISNDRQVRLLQLLHTADKFFKKPFSEVSQRDFDSYHEYLKKNFTPHSLYGYMAGLKQFYRWLDRGKHFKRISRIRLSKPRSPYTPEDLFTGEEQTRMIEIAKGRFWKAFLDGFRFSRCRPSEYILLKRKDVILRVSDIMLHIPKHKNNYSERVIIIKEECPLFRTYVERIADPEKYIFYRQGWNYSTYMNRFRRTVRKAGIEKLPRLYLYRHTSYTRDVMMGIPGEIRDALYGHSPDSRMRGYYSHLNAAMIDEYLENAFHKRDHESIPFGRCN